MLTLGSTPYSTIENNELENYLLGGNRLRLPGCVDSESSLIPLLQQIWAFEPQERPNFKTIVKYLEDILLNEDLKIILNSEFFELYSATTTTHTDSGFEKTPLLYPS